MSMIRKHISQMTTEEITYLQNRLNTKFKLTTHAEKRKKTRHIDMGGGRFDLKTFSLMDYYSKSPVSFGVVVMRRFRKYTLFVVINFYDDSIVTMYKRYVTDKPKHILLYKNNLKII